MELFLDQGNYMLQKLSRNAGARMVLHDPSIPPLPDEYGIDLAPNTASSVAVQIVTNFYLAPKELPILIVVSQTEISRLPHPYTSNCTTFWNETVYGDQMSESVAYTMAVSKNFEKPS